MKRTQIYGLTRNEFDHWGEYLDHVTDTKVPRWTKANYSRMTSEPGWSGSPDFAAAERIARYGWPEGRNKIVQGVAAAQAIRTPMLSSARNYDVGGAYPDVPLFIAGDPAHMVNPEPVERAVKHIVRIILNISASASVDPETIINRGVAVLSYIDAMESAGHAVELVAAHAVTARNNAPRFETLIPIKAAGQPWEPDRVAFILAHPSMLRRLHFAAYEREMHLEEHMSSNYGTPAALREDARGGAIYFTALAPWDRSDKTDWRTLAGAMKTAERILRDGGAPLADYTDEAA